MLNQQHEKKYTVIEPGKHERGDCSQSSVGREHPLVEIMK